MVFYETSFAGFRVSLVANPDVVKERGSFSLACFVAGGQTSGASVTWQKDEGPLIIDGKRITSFTDEFIYVTDARGDDTGVYECTVKKGFTVRSARIYVTVEGLIVDPLCFSVHSDSFSGQ